ncbi:MAG: inositol-3-phosphate synthase [Trebonia sp.]
MNAIGIWLTGARGSVATTTIVGAAALAGGCDTTGCVTELPDFAGAGLAPFRAMTFGGHDISGMPLAKRAQGLALGGVIPAGLAVAAGARLAAAEREIRPGISAADRGCPQAEDIQRCAGDIIAFRQRHELDQVVVVNVASTEPPVRLTAPLESLADLEDELLKRAGVLPPSAAYAMAAFQADCPFVEFTASASLRIPAVQQHAVKCGLPYAGRDAKTGETLVKSVLAPMFARRALRVRSWSGTNLLGGGDGMTLSEPGAALSKTRSKSATLRHILEYPVEGVTNINCVPEMGDWKTAWDHISFEGFLGARMVMQFTWQGCDSALAAPLVLDLARLMALARTRGEAGPQSQLGFFFKDPLGPVPAATSTASSDLAGQYETLRCWAGQSGGRG